ncbi:TnpV protein [bacterium]|nr:TnpV protein [bacterium]
MASLFEEMGGTYTLGADGMYYPNLEFPEEEAPRYGKYGRMRHTYLREHKKAYYTTLLFNGKLVTHLNEIDDIANTQMGLITKQMAQSRILPKH